MTLFLKVVAVAEVVVFILVTFCLSVNADFGAVVPLEIVPTGTPRSPIQSPIFSFLC